MGVTQLNLVYPVSSVLSLFSLSKKHAFDVLWQDACGMAADLCHIFQLAKRIFI